MLAAYLCNCVIGWLENDLLPPVRISIGIVAATGISHELIFYVCLCRFSC